MIGSFGSDLFRSTFLNIALWQLAANFNNFVHIHALTDLTLIFRTIRFCFVENNPVLKTVVVDVGNFPFQIWRYFKVLKTDYKFQDIENS